MRFFPMNVIDCSATAPSPADPASRHSHRSTPWTHCVCLVASERNAKTSLAGFLMTRSAVYVYICFSDVVRTLTILYHTLQVPRRNYVKVDRAMEDRWPGSDALATELAINLYVLAGEVQAFAEQLCGKHKVPSPTAFNVLTILEGAGTALAPSFIADRMLVTRPTMTGILDSLEKRALIKIGPHPEDGRMSLVTLTAKGRGVVTRMRPELHAAEAR